LWFCFCFFVFGGTLSWNQSLHLEPFQLAFNLIFFFLFDMGSFWLFAWAGFEPQSSWEQPPYRHESPPPSTWISSSQRMVGPPGWTSSPAICCATFSSLSYILIHTLSLSLLWTIHFWGIYRSNHLLLINCS
jgi:hypothetical protein